jgi:hypothetical protein
VADGSTPPEPTLALGGGDGQRTNPDRQLASPFR